MKKIRNTIFILLAVTLFTSCDVLMQVLQTAQNTTNQTTGPTSDEIVQGLKTALSLGTDTAVTVLNKNGGYFNNPLIKIMLPPEAKPIMENIAQVPGGQKMMDDVILRINRSAEDAASEAKPIFVDAITSMTITDGLNILRGATPNKPGFDSLAATSYLQTKTRAQLKSLFAPKIKNSLDKPLVANVSTNAAWTNLTNAYNLWAQFKGKPKVNTDLTDFVTEKALDGLFYKIGLEEKKIRKNPYKWALNIIQKVFGYVYKAS